MTPRPACSQLYLATVNGGTAGETYDAGRVMASEDRPTGAWRQMAYPPIQLLSGRRSQDKQLIGRKEAVYDLWAKLSLQRSFVPPGIDDRPSGEASTAEVNDDPLYAVPPTPYLTCHTLALFLRRRLLLLLLVLPL